MVQKYYKIKEEIHVGIPRCPFGCPFYSTNDSFESTIRQLDSILDNNQKLQQVAAEIHETCSSAKLQQVVAEIEFPTVFSFVPWGHHIEIITKCKDIDEALFYIKRTIERGLSRLALDDCIRADLFHTSGAALTNFSEKLPDAQGKIAQEIRFSIIYTYVVM